MKRFVCWGAMLLGLHISLFAQSPGYMGKHTFIKADIAYAPALSKPTANNRGGEVYGNQAARLGLNTRYGLQAGYAFSRRRALAVEANYLSTGMTLNAYTGSMQYEGNSDEHYLFYNLRGPELGLSLQTYDLLRGSIAPMGFFSTWRLRMAWLNGLILDKQTNYYSDESAGHGQLGIRPRYTQLTVGAEVGRHMIIADRIVLSLSAEFNIDPLNFRLTDYNDISDGNNQERFEDAAAKRMRFHSLVMFKMGLGYLF